MTKSLPTVVFFGSGPVAAESLKLLTTHFTVEAVITKASPPHHRRSAPVIDFVEQKNIPYFTPPAKTDLSELFQKEKFTSPVGIVIDYGIIISQSVIDYFPFGIVNSHFSLLPELRGADPITFSLLSGQKETGVSLMTIDAAMDEGPLLARDKLIIQDADNSTTLTHKLIHLSDQLLSTHLSDYLDGRLQPYPQTGEPTYSRKLTKADGRVDWHKPASVLEREIRAYYEWPKSTATIGPHQVILRKADVIKTSGTPGKYTKTKNELIVYCGKDALRIEVLQPLNKKEMPVQAFLAGYSL